MPRVSVLMPTYAHEAYIRRAIGSLLSQTFSDWELIVVDDGSPDNTYAAVQQLLNDQRIRYFRLDENTGLGSALNYGLGRALGKFIAYLPSDDIYYPDHLSSLVDTLAHHPESVLAYAEVRHHYNRVSTVTPTGESLQLVQVMHRSIPLRWVERNELVTNDLERMFWKQLRKHGEFNGTGKVTCEWVSHPDQLHKSILEPEGGINTYRSRFNVQKPLRFHSTVGNYIDEVEHYRRFRERPDTPPAADGLKILLVGELAYNAERVLALEEQGHRLYGLWMPEPYWYNTVGPLPFGHVQDVSRKNWAQEVRRIQPDVIYALLNWQAVPFARQVLAENPGIPFVWHFKEGPFICLEKGMWNDLVDLYRYSDGQIFVSPEMQQWFETILPGQLNPETSLVLDGDLPKRDWFSEKVTPRLSESDGEIHTVVPGRPIGLHPQNVVELGEQGIHLHFYGDFTHGQWLEWIEKTMRLTPGYIHLHRQVDQDRWVEEFSRYDAGWLHYFESQNQGDIRRANWDDLNYPARISTLVAAGLPLLQRKNAGATVAAQNLASDLDIGLFFTNAAELRSQFDDRDRMKQLYESVWRQRKKFSFDDHVDRLVQFFRSIINQKLRTSYSDPGALLFPVTNPAKESAGNFQDTIASTLIDQKSAK